MPLMVSPGTIPGPHRPGLIEACPSRPPAKRRTRIPGPHRPGLIEAEHCRTDDAALIRKFRGLTAPASLKRPTPPCNPTGRSKIPGPHRPGLIEASTVSVRLCRGQRKFRGLTAPASLKRTRGALASRSAGKIPGPHRPGLIEAKVSPRNRDGRGRRIPGPHRPGLIEAFRLWRSALPFSPKFRGLTAPASLKRRCELTLEVVRLAHNSGASPPRPH